MENSGLVRAVRARAVNWRPGDPAGALVVISDGRRKGAPDVVVEGNDPPPDWIGELVRFVDGGDPPDWLGERERFEIVAVNDSLCLVLKRGTPSDFVIPEANAKRRRPRR